MEIFSLKFLGILLIAIVILIFMARRKRRGPVMVRGKQIAIRGNKLTTPITKNTPLTCLLDEGKTFGEDFKDKTPPNLPHTDQCQCELVPVIHRSHDWFNQGEKSNENFQTDLGVLDRNRFRFYKYMLIAHHPEAETETRTVFKELAERIPVGNSFKDTVVQQFSSDG